MYESRFQLRQRPFGAAPSPDCYFPAPSIEQARQSLIRSIERAEGPGLVVGPSGSGKTLLCRLIAKQFQGRYKIALLSGARLGTRRALLQNILFELRLPYRDMDEGELRLSLVDQLESTADGSQGLLLLVDEAQLLPLRLIDEIRLMTNLLRDGQPCVRLVLSGSAALEERLAHPKLESLQQRLAARCYLQPLNREETTAYIHHQIAHVGGDAARLFTQDALQAVYSATDGIPRLINQVCDHALVLAAVAGASRLNAAAIQESWADLQQLPTPWNEPARAVDMAPADIIEFGSLDEPVRQSADVAASAEAQLDRIDRGVASIEFGVLDDEEAPVHLHRPAMDDFRPVDPAATEVELTFPTQADFFGGQWEEEEVVIDRYASLEAQSVSRRPRVRSDEGRQLGSSLAKLDAPVTASSAESGPIQRPAARPMRIEPRDEETFDAATFDPASDPVLPPIGGNGFHTVGPAPISLDRIAEDDRDIIVLDDNAASGHALAPAAPKRQEYRRLFTKLRNR